MVMIKSVEFDLGSLIETNLGRKIQEQDDFRYLRSFFYFCDPR